ncbi:toll/interleukin-1 receptor domain-containing protein [Xanthomonas hortorum]|uniref:toll/interleukin-1 receptor domain-containing protein n=1 Tax=Xanthomonas TaxID=338 RepID=UPI0021B40C94|nr:toll/interleukin-1 receptor domain-containing protein [Xanthomonas prunicola]UXA48852.1 toll/interleukin-1 receptor domain-containing protein [Xanthomonas prunicola]
MPTIFLSHNYNDKPVVEPVAIQLRNIYGQNAIFYDDWSIQPGDGIIDRMNNGLATPDFFFFFVTENSLKSNMVKLEWQSALYQATKGNVVFVPVRVDGAPMPSIIMQNSYIDMHTNGVLAAIQQIKDRISGDSEFKPKHENFSNLTFSISGDPKEQLRVTIIASHLQELNPKFMFMVKNNKDEVFVWIEGASAVHSGPNNYHEVEGAGEVAGMVCAPFNGTIRPSFPLTFTITPKQDCKPVEFLGVLHETKANWFEPIPPSAGTQ